MESNVTTYQSISSASPLPVEPAATRSVWPWIVATVLVMMGAFGFIERLTDGLRPTALSSYVPWGIWAAVYEFLVWLEVGSLLVFGVLYYNFGWKKLKPIAPTVYLAGLVIMVMALVTIAMDLGQMFRFWRVYLSPQFSSPLAWMVWLHTLYMIILLAKLWQSMGEDRPLSKALHWVSLPLGVVLVALAGAVFGIVAARPLWSMTNLPLHFLMASLLAGAALVALQVRLFARQLPDGVAEELLLSLRPVILGLMVAAVLAAVLTGVVLLASHSPANLESLYLVLFGPYWWSYWILHIGLGVVVPAILLVSAGRSSQMVWLAALLIVAGFSALPPNLVIPGLASGTIKGLSEAYYDSRLHLAYFPSTNEWLVLMFVVGMGWLAFLIGRRVLGLTVARPN